MVEDPRWDLGVGPDPRAVGYLEGKGLQRSWRWASMWHEEHAYAFTLAGVYRLDVLQAAKDLVTRAVAEGQTLEQFRSGFEEGLKGLGFAGPQVSEGFSEGPRNVNLSAPWRTRVIYDTNVRQAYAASEWAAIEDTAADFPALQYHHLPQEHPRLQHLAWDKVVLPVTHSFWKSHFPPNGWFCKCWVTQISVDQLASGKVKITSSRALRATGYTSEAESWPTWTDARTGRTEHVPEGVSPGFGYNAGQERRRNLGDLLERKLGGMDEDLARAAAADLVNFPVFQDLVQDAVGLGQARASAARAAAARLAGGSATKADIDRAAHEAADQVGRFPSDSWPVAVAPAELAGDGGRLVVANASAIGHSADQHPTVASDWGRIQLMLEQGEIRRAESGDLHLFGQFAGDDGKVTTWTAVLKAVDGAWRVRTLFQSSPRRQASIAKRTTLVRSAAGLIRLG